MLGKRCTSELHSQPWLVVLEPKYKSLKAFLVDKVWGAEW